MSKMISVSSGFQYSVNIGFDLNNDEKLKNFIPTKASLALLKDILLSTRPSSTERARVLIGAYGKGKSHIVLTILAMLYKRDKRLFEKLLPKAAEDHQLMQPHAVAEIIPDEENGGTTVKAAYICSLEDMTFPVTAPGR